MKISSPTPPEPKFFQSSNAALVDALILGILTILAFWNWYKSVTVSGAKIYALKVEPADATEPTDAEVKS